jgi:hypothetical protein
MRYLVLGAVLLFTTAGTARADTGLTDAVAAAFLVRHVDATLHDIAHARVAELAAAGRLSHDGMRPGTAEVVAYNSGVANPVANAVGQWIGGTHWFACVLAAGPLPAQGGTLSSGSSALPDTRMAHPTVSMAARLRPSLD